MRCHIISRQSPTTLPISGSRSVLFKYAQCSANAVNLNNHVAVVKNMSSSLAFNRSFPRYNPFATLQINVGVGDAFNSSKCHQSKVSENLILGEDKVIGYIDSVEGIEDDKERQRRRKIGLANMGRVPWNKGKKHSAETCQRIKQRTIEALRDPKVRKKMSEHPRPHSDHIKAKISSSLRSIWQERLKLKWSRERFFCSWQESIAEAAKKGETDQLELEWDSYDKIKQEMVLQQHQWVVEKAKAKQVAKTRAEKIILSWAESIAKAAKKGGKNQQELDWDSYDKIKQEDVFRQLQRTAEKAKAKERKNIRARLAQKRKELQEKARARGEIEVKTHRKSKEDKDDLAVFQESNLKQRLTKIHKKKSINDQLADRGDTVASHFGALEKLNLEHIKREKTRREVSLADQIQAARKKKESLAREVVAAHTLITDPIEI
ncbi:hypothetical protein F2P56_005124 [Juglans regia]|uniref:Nuclease associated modular domain-containing protein n=1 Tax=Juglans regia TaxID=51240 RepID=A0A833Y6L0_JUGRE|nr:hypothetical protein F2P56_005124 [Juglans regia]